MKKRWLWRMLGLVVIFSLLIAIPVFAEAERFDPNNFTPPGWDMYVNVLGGSLTFPFAILCMLVWFFKDMAIACPKKPNGWQKVYKVFRAIHIPLGAFVMAFGLYHAIYATIRHGYGAFELTWGKAAYIFFFLCFIAWLLRKPLKNYWRILHRTTATLAVICLCIHSVPMLQFNFGVIIPMMLGLK